MDKRGGMEGVSKFSVEKFLSNNTEYFRWRKFGFLENFWYPKNLWKKGGWREYHNFPSKNFCLTVPKNFVGENFGV